jgi:PAS domain S-box-containing protein
MNIDIRTLALILVVLDLVLIITIYLSFLLNKTYRGVGWWLLWGAATGLGFLFMLSRDIVPSDLIPASVLLTNASLASGQIFLYTGIMRFLDKKENLRIIIPVFAVFVLSTIYTLYISRDAAARALILYATGALFSLITAQGLFAHKQGTFSASAIFVAIVLLIHGSYFTLRALAAITIVPIDPVFTSTLLQATTFLVALITGALCTSGLIIMLFQRANAEMREAKEQFELIFNTGPDAAAITRPDDGFILNINEGFVAFTGFTRDEAIGQSILALNIWNDPADRRHVVGELAARGYCQNYEAVFRSKDGSRMDGTISAKIITLQGVQYMISIMHDISERKRLEEERQRISKLEALGQVTGGIARDFNDALTDILGNVSLARMETAPGSGIRDRLEKAEKAVLGTRELTGKLLTFSRTAEPVRGLVSVVDLLNDTASFALRGSNVKCRLSLPANLRPAMIDRVLVSRAINNLLINARQAMPGGGAMEITAENITFGKERVQGHGLKLKDGNYIRISVTDHGSGIPAEQLDRIFDPFFSPGQEGSGLGLAISFSIARQHGGHLSAESKPGAGTTFCLYLPASMETAATHQDKKTPRSARTEGKP